MDRSKQKSPPLVLFLCLTLLLLALFPLRARAADSYGVSINGTALTADNAATLFPGCTVSYDPASQTLTVQAADSQRPILLAQTTITGNDKVNLVLDGSQLSSAPFSAPPITIEHVNKLTVIGGPNVHFFNGESTIQHVGAVALTASGKAPLTNNAFPLHILDCAGNIDFAIAGSAAGSAPIIAGDLEIQSCAGNVTAAVQMAQPIFGRNVSVCCNGSVTFTNDAGIAISGNLTVSKQDGFTPDDVTVSGNVAVGGTATVACSGNVSFTGNGNVVMTGFLTVNSAQDVVVSTTVNGPALVDGASITCDGKVTISNPTGFAVNAASADGNLTIKAESVNISAATDALKCAVTLECSGDVVITSASGCPVRDLLTVNSAKNVTVSGSTSSTLLSPSYLSKVKCSGTATFINYNSAGRLGLFDYTQADGNAYRIMAGSSKTDAVECTSDILNKDISYAYLLIQPARTVTVAGGTASLVTDAARRSADGPDSAAATLSAFAGQRVRIEADDPDNFHKWQVTKGTIQNLDAGSSSTEFIMPDEDVALTAAAASGTSDGEEIRSGGGDGTLAAVVVGGATAWGVYEAGTGIYRMKYMRGIPLPSTRAELALLIWRRAGEPEPDSTALYADIDADDDALQKAARWMVEQELLDEKKDNTFQPGRHVTKLRVCVTWDKARQKGLID